METAPSRLDCALARLTYAALAGAQVGGAEAIRVVSGGRLWMSDGEAFALIIVGAASAMLVALPAGIAVALAPVKPLGRSRWMGFLAGMFSVVFASVAVAWFTDPAPFTDPFPGQGSVVAFAGIVGALSAAAIALYQGLRGLRAVQTGILSISVVLAGWILAGNREAPGVHSAPAVPRASAADAPPNVLVVTLDTTRADHLGAYGNADIDTRFFDGLAEAGTRFQNASAVAPVTGPSHASMFMGAGPWEHGVLLNGVPLPTDRALLAEVLQDHGYTTGAFVSAYVLAGNLGFSRGFTTYDDDFSWLVGLDRLLAPRIAAMARRRMDPDEVLERRGGDTVDAALTWLAGRPAPWFLWVHLFDAHGPYAPPPPFDTRYYSGDPRDPGNNSMKELMGIAAYLVPSLRGITDVNWVLAQYSGEVSYADSQLGRLLGAVDEKTTLVAVMGDHGESLGEHGVWFNHGDDVYETSVHVPFAVRWPNHVPIGVDVAPVEGSDLAPTILDLLDVPAPARMTGRPAFLDVAPELAPSETLIVARSLCYDRAANQSERAAGRITKPRYLMAGLGGGSFRYTLDQLKDEAHYFDLAADPAGVEVGEIDAAVSGALHHEASVLFGADTRRSSMQVPAEERERLRLLGYEEP